MGKGSIYLVLDKGSVEYLFQKKYEISQGIDSDYSFSILSDINEPFNKVICNYDAIRKSLNESFKFYDNSNLGEFERQGEFIKNYLNKDDNFYKNLINNVDTINIDIKLDELEEYLKLNPELSNKKIILSGQYKLDEDLSILDTYKSYDNIYVYAEGNTDPIKINDLIKTQNIIDDSINRVRKYSFSPIEQIMYLYDFVRDRVYIRENNNDNYTESRDLTKVLLGDKIVCLGYARLFDILLKRLGFSTSIYYIRRSDGRGGHARNIIYVKDDKYDIDAVFYFDTTWDSKVNGNKFLYSYRYFCKNKNFFEEIQNGKYKDETLLEYNKTMINKFINTLESKGIKGVSLNELRTVNRMAKIIDRKILVNELWLKSYGLEIPDALKGEYDKEKVIKSVKRYDELFNKKISADMI